MIESIPIEHLLLGVAAFLLLSIIASKASGRLGVPALALFLLIGMLAGSDGPGGIYFDNPRLAQSLGVVALALILYSGGLDTDWKRVRPIAGWGLALSTFGVLLTALLMGLFAMAVLRLSLWQGLLLGAIVSSTDAAAVFTVLRSRSVRLRDPLEPLLEFESGSNDPMAVFLTVGLTGLLVDPTASPAELLPIFFRQMALGAAIGYGSGRAMTWIVNRVRLQSEGLYPALTLAMVLMTYGATAALGGNGFLAVYLAGLVMGKADFIHKRSLMRFHDAIAWLMQIAMFLTLGLLVFPARLPAVAGIGLLSAAFLIFVARPVAVFVTLLPMKIRWEKKTMVAWVGLRGAVPIILATFPRLAGLPQADLIFDVVFFITLTSVLIQGTSIPFVARWLRVTASAPAPARAPIELHPTDQLNSALVEVPIAPGSGAIGRQLVDLGLPPSALVVLIGRGAEFIVPNGSTVIESGDRLLVLADSKALTTTRQMVETQHEPARA